MKHWGLPDSGIGSQRIVFRAETAGIDRRSSESFDCRLATWLLMMSIDEFGGNPLRSSPPTSSIRQKKIEQIWKKQHKKTRKKRQLPQLASVE